MYQTCTAPSENPEDSGYQVPRRVVILNRIIAVCQVFGGVFGLAIIAFSRVSTYGLLVLLMAGLFGASVYGGILLARGSRRGVAVSALVQGAQVVQFGIPLLAYHFLAGPVVRVIAFTANDDLRLSFNWGAQSSIFMWLGLRVPNQTPAFFGPADATLLGVNIVALAACLFLLRQLVDPTPDREN